MPIQRNGKWHVQDSDGNLVGEFATKEEAISSAKRWTEDFFKDRYGTDITKKHGPYYGPPERPQSANEIAKAIEEKRKLAPSRVGSAMSRVEAREAARANGWKEVADAPFNSHGQPVFSDGSKYYTPDADGHIGGVWKQFDKKGNRTGTLDGNLNKIGK
ncbi:MAG: toxin C-terminal domain-containing protein [Gemmataceae bacterium]